MDYRITLDRANMVKLHSFLWAEFQKRRDDEPFFSVRQWAEEIGMSHSTLTRWMNDKDASVEIGPDNLNALVSFFGKPFLDVLGVEVPQVPRNPKYNH